MTPDDLDQEALRMQLVQAYTRAVHPDAIAHIHAALRELDPDLPPGLVRCEVCLRTMLPERLDCHDCHAPSRPPRSSGEINPADGSDTGSISGSTGAGSETTPDRN